MRRVLTLALALSGALFASPSLATTVTDPAGDFVASYTGTHAGDLDILSASAFVSGSNLVLSATVNGAVGATPNSLYVFGIDRGGGIPRFGIPVAFDAIGVLFPSGVARAVVFPPGPPTGLTVLPTGATVNGSTITGVFALSLFPGNGLSIEDYRFTVWSRLRVNPAADGLIGEVADYAPDAGGFRAVPEPATWAMLIAGFGGVGATLRQRRKAASAHG